MSQWTLHSVNHDSMFNQKRIIPYFQIWWSIHNFKFHWNTKDFIHIYEGNSISNGQIENNWHTSPYAMIFFHVFTFFGGSLNISKRAFLFPRKARNQLSSSLRCYPWILVISVFPLIVDKMNQNGLLTFKHFSCLKAMTSIRYLIITHTIDMIYSSHTLARSRRLSRL